MEDKKCAMDTREIVELLCDIADQVGSLIGDKRAVSVFRYAGKKLGKRIGSGHQGNAEDARILVRAFFKDKEFMDGIDLEGTEAKLLGCKIGLTLRDRGINAGSHALCHFGFGLIDGVMEGVTGHKIVTLHKDSTYHEDGVTCHETW
jgi:predicted hydrocarbon binding protein